MKKASSILLIVVFVLSFAASPCFSGFAFASSPVTWEDLGDDAIALRDSYFNLWSSGSAGDFFRNAADIPVSWFKTLSDGVLALSPIDDLFFTYEEVKPVIQTGSPKMRDWVSKHNITPDTPVISSEDFAEKIELDNQLYTAKDYNQIISFLTDKYFHQQIDNYSSYNGFCYYAPVLEFSGCFFGGGANDVYFVPFYKGKDYSYLGMYQFHLTFETVTLDDGSSILAPRLLAWNIFDGETELNAVNLFDDTTSDFSSFKYIRCEMWNDTYFTFSFYSTLSDFLSNNNSSSVFFGSASKYLKLYRADLLGNTTYYNQMKSSLHYYQGSIDYFNQNHPDYIGTDIGFYVSDKPITTTYQFIDTTKIPANQIITINGDTIYNYTITNPDTGESNTINEYVTNNYTYITNNGGEAGSSSGSGGGGNVTVGGSIDVGGSVGVDITVSVPDININVNGNGSGVGGSGSLPDTDLVENLPEAPSGFIDYTASLFSFLPAEILSLLIAGLAAAIFCRIWGR